VIPSDPVFAPKRRIERRRLECLALVLVEQWMIFCLLSLPGRSKGLSDVLKLPENLSDLLAFDPDTLAVTGREGKRREFKLD
jgi:hypothetical protein